MDNFREGKVLWITGSVMQMEGQFLRLLFAILLSEHRKAPAAGAESGWADEPSVRDCKEKDWDLPTAMMRGVEQAEKRREVYTFLPTFAQPAAHQMCILLCSLFGKASIGSN